MPRRKPRAMRSAMCLLKNGVFAGSPGGSLCGGCCRAGVARSARLKCRDEKSPASNPPATKPASPYDTEHGLLRARRASQVAMHEAYGGVVPELASRDHIRRLVPLLPATCSNRRRRNWTMSTPSPHGRARPGRRAAGRRQLSPLRLAMARGIPALPVHHLEGHRSAAAGARCARISLRRAAGLRRSHPADARHRRRQGRAARRIPRRRRRRSLRQDRQTARTPAIPAARRSPLCPLGQPGRFKLPRPMLRSGDFDFSFSGLKTRC